MDIYSHPSTISKIELIDENTFATSCFDSIIRIWDIKT